MSAAGCMTAETARRIAAIQHRACAKHGITMEELRGRGRRDKLVMARHEAILVSYCATNASTVKIGWAFDRHHTSILWAVGRIKGPRPPVARLIKPAGERRYGAPIELREILK